MMARRESFWDWSLDRYPRGKAALLSLQDKAGFNVNLLLWCVWRARAGATLDAAAIKAAIDAVAPWREQVTQPLRAVRRRLAAFGPAGDAMRPRTAAAELEAERLEQELLQAVGGDGAAGAELSSARAAARANLELYTALAGSGRSAGYSGELAALAELLLP